MSERPSVPMAVWKYPLEIVDEQLVLMPRAAAPLTAQYQGEDLVLWMAVTPDSPKEKRSIHILGTGNPCVLRTPVRYVATAQDPARPLVWHVYISEQGKPTR